MSEHIIYHIADGIATLTLNRPKVLNAINYDLLKELDELLDQAAADDSLRVLILTGSGKAFAAGADIAQQAGMDQEEAAKWGRYGSGIFRRLECFPIPTLAVVNGYALGGGCEMAMACDLILAGEKAKFGQPETGLGITPGFSGTQRLLRRVGVSKAKELIYTGRMIDAQEALQIGLADHIYPDDQLQAEALAMAKKIAANAPVAVRYAKCAINEGAQADIDTAIAIENKWFSKCFATQDQRKACRHSSKSARQHSSISSLQIKIKAE